MQVNAPVQQAGLAALRARLGPLDARLTAGREAAGLALACGTLVLLATLEAARQTYPFFDDVAYLVLGHEVHALGGPLGLLRALLAGTFSEANRHPLYLALLGLVARPGPGYHRAAQALNLGLGVLAMLACWWTARRHLGRSAALALAFLLAASRTFVSCAAHEGCEPLLVAVWALAIGAVLDGLDESRSSRLWPWIRAGLWSGLAYLTKGTGMFLPVSLALAFVLQERLRALLDRRAWVYGAAFLAAASPLLIRNLRLFGTPFYNFNLHTLWQDRLPDFAEIYAPQAPAELPHGFLDYLHHLTPGALAWRIAVGIGETTFLFAESMAPVGGAPARPLHIAAVIAGAVAAAVALRLIWRNAGGFVRTFLVIHAGWTWFFIFIFSVNGGNTRYFLPLAATVLLPALSARVCTDIAQAGSVRLSRWARWTFGIAAGAATASLVFHGPVMRKPGMNEVRDWLASHLQPGDTYAVDARSHLQPQWIAPGSQQLLVSASWRERPVPTDVMLAYLQAQHVRYVLLDASSEATVASLDAAGRRYLFYDRMPLEPDGSLPLRGIPAGFTAVYVDPETPRRWMVLETPWAAGTGARSRK